MKRIIFICTGNICRSPMAHYYMQSRIKELKKENEYLIDSCGTYASTGEKATNNAIRAIKEYNVDLTSHRAKNIRDVDIENYDLILCLTIAHKRAVLSMFPKLKGKVYTLKEYVQTDNKYIDIDDPWGLDIDVYKDCAKDIVQNVDKLLDKI